jgi:toxin ParE1/3/4
VSAIVVRLPSALRDLDEAADYLRRQNGPERAIGFLRNADSTFTRLANMPGLGTRYDPDEPVFANLRFFPISRFRKYLVFYRPIMDGIEVLRVLHGARDIRSLLAEEFGLDQDADEDTAEDEIQ